MPDVLPLQVSCDAHLGTLHLSLSFSVTQPWSVLFGPSGSGKSSVLRLIAGVWRPANCAVFLGRKELTNVPPHRRGIGLVAQHPALFPHLDVLANVRFGCNDSGVAEAMLHLFDLEDLRHARVAQLSGGEQQRVALARALTAQPRFLLLDEVFTGMDYALRDTLLTRLQTHCRERQLPVLHVTHDPVEAVLVADEVFRLQGSTIVAHGEAPTVLHVELNAMRQHLAG